MAGLQEHLQGGGRGQQDLVDDGLISLLVKQKGRDRSQGLQLTSLNFFARRYRKVVWLAETESL